MPFAWTCTCAAHGGGIVHTSSMSRRVLYAGQRDFQVSKSDMAAVQTGQGVQKRCPGWAHSTDDLYDTDKGVMKAEGQARLELPRNPGYTSVDFCMCGTKRGQEGKKPVAVSSYWTM